MSTSTITAEGGTIRLSTASDGSVSASSGDFAVAVVQQVVGGGVSAFPGLSTAPFLAASGLYLTNALNGAAGTGSTTADDQELVPFICTYTTTIDQVGFHIASSAAGSNGKVLVFDADANGRPFGLPLLESADMPTTGTSGIKTDAQSFTFQAGKLYWLGRWHSAGISLRRVAANSAPVLGYDNSAPPLAYHTLVRSVPYAASSTAWVYDNAQLSTRLAALTYVRIA